MMPISPENKERYPPNWAWIRLGILWRAGYRCEGSPAYPDCRAENYRPHPVTGSKVILTIAHLDHIPENCDGLEAMEPGPWNEDTAGLLRPVKKSNLRAWCQRCHLTYDAPFHAENAAATRALLAEILAVAAIGALAPKAWRNLDTRRVQVETMTYACRAFLAAADRWRNLKGGQS